MRRLKRRKLNRIKNKVQINSKPTRSERRQGKYFGRSDEGSSGDTFKKKKLTRLQQRMIDEYMKDFNGFRAYKAAGGKGEGATGRACTAQILCYSHVQKEIRQRQTILREQSGVETLDVVRELMRIAFADMKDYAQWSSGTVVLKDSEELDPSLSCAVSEVVETPGKLGSTIKIKLHPKIQALKMLGEHLNLFGKVEPDNETIEEKAQKIRAAVNGIFTSVPITDEGSNETTSTVIPLKGKKGGSKDGKNEKKK